MLFFMLMVVTGSLNRATAQKFNTSDWHVPPPLPPANTIRTNPAGGTKSNPVVLNLTDIPAVILPAVSPVQAPFLAAVFTTPPQVNEPGQPGITGFGSNLPDIPTPGAPDAPPLSKDVPQDAPAPSIIEMPVPAAPEIPAFPAQPSPSATMPAVHGPIPLLPDIISPPNLFQPPGGPVNNTWPTPGIPEDMSINPAQNTKGAKAGGKRKRTKKPVIN
jgi:hypothetical protein